MKLAAADHILTEIIAGRRQESPLDRFGATVLAERRIEPRIETMQAQDFMRTTLTIGMNAYAELGALAEVRERHAQSIMRTLYHEIDDEIEGIINQAWKDGIQKSKTVQRLSELSKELRELMYGD